MLEWRPKSFWSHFGNWSRPIKSSSGQPPRTNHTTVSRCRHCDGEVVVHSIHGHLVLITRLRLLYHLRNLGRRRNINELILYGPYKVIGNTKRARSHGSGKPGCSYWSLGHSFSFIYVSCELVNSVF